jgi:hypothetical protein
MTDTIKFAKVNVLPITFEPSTIYLVKDADEAFAKMFISNAAGTAVRRLPNRDDIQTMVNQVVNQAVAGTSHLYVVADIAGRDALTPTVVTQALVIDATGDTSVVSGAATYVFNPTDTSWTKISEHESMDFVLQWANIQGRPTSTAAEIDDAVSKRHSHANLVSLDKVGEDAGGLLQFNGDYVDPALRVAEW